MFTACLIPIIKLNALFQWSKKLIVRKVAFVFFLYFKVIFSIFDISEVYKDLLSTFFLFVDFGEIILSLNLITF